MTQRGFLAGGLAILVCLIAASADQAHAAWRMAGESKNASKGQTGLTMAFTFAWDIKSVQYTLPLVVRHVEGSAFWTGSLPYDTVDSFGDRFSQGVTWHASVPPFAGIIYEVRPGPGCGGSALYDGVSPDYFAISAQGTAGLNPQPAGIVFVTVGFDVNQQAGEFEFDTACFSGSLTAIFMVDVLTVDHGPTGTNEATWVKGTVTIPPGSQAIQVESRTVPTSSTAVQVGVSIANDDPLQRITLPLVCRNLTGGAFWTNVPASLDTLPWGGRLTSALTFSRVLDKSQVDGTTPDAFLVEAYKNGDPALAPGPSQEMITLLFDVNGSGGSFEIDTAFFPPNKGFRVETPGDPGVVLTPAFSKGTITLVPPDTGNKVEIGTAQAQAKTKGIVLDFKIVASQRVESITIPLRARSVSGGAFWAANFDTLSWVMTPPAALTYLRQVQKQLNFDYQSPDDFLIRARTAPPQRVCLDAGTHPAFLSIRFDLNNNAGVFEVDTSFIPPVSGLNFGWCDQPGTVKPSFTKGIVTINPCDCSDNGDVNCDGLYNPLDVVRMVNYVYKGQFPPCNPGNCFQNGDVNCDSLINPLDVVAMVKHVYKNQGSPCDPCTI